MGFFKKGKEKKDSKFIETQNRLFEEYDKHQSGNFSIRTDGNSTIVFKDDVLIVSTDLGEEYPIYHVVSKNEKGEKVLTRMSLRKSVNIDMRCEDLDLLVYDGENNYEYRVDEADYFYKGDELKYVTDQLNLILDFNDLKRKYETSKSFFANVIKGVKDGTIPVQIQAKCVCVDARIASPEEVGTKFIVWSHGKVEKEIDVKEDTVFITSLDVNGKPIVDEAGHTNIYDMPLEKFKKRYQKHANGHYVQSPTPMATIKLGDDVIPEDGIELLPPNWGGYAGTLMRGGLLMLPFDSSLSGEELVNKWESYLQGTPLDWYPNNEADTYAVCDRNGKFVDKKLRELYCQDKERAE